MKHKKYKQLSSEERYTIELLVRQGASQKEIAETLGRDKSTISREMKRHHSQTVPVYYAKRAHNMSMTRHSLSHKRRRLKSPQLRYNVEQMILSGLSPQQISCRLKLEAGTQIISHEAIYQWIYKDAKSLSSYLPRIRDVRRKHYSNKRGEGIKGRVGIEQRPSGRRVEDWEADLIVSRRSKAALQVCVDRGSRLVRLKKLEDKSSDSVYRAITALLHKSECRSITYDNGKENALHAEINEKLECKSYFCNPYHSWEKGSVEQTNGIIRRYYPKKTDLHKVDEEELKRVEESLNNRPMKCLGWRTPNEIFYGYEEKDIMDLTKKMINPVTVRFKNSNPVALTP